MLWLWRLCRARARRAWTDTQQDCNTDAEGQVCLHSLRQAIYHWVYS